MGGVRIINKTKNRFGMLDNDKYLGDNKAGKRVRGSCGGGVISSKVVKESLLKR